MSSAKSATKSTYATKRAPITTDEIIKGFQAHGHEFMIIDIDCARVSKYAHYISIYIKTESGDIIHPTYWKMSNEGVKTCSNITEPSKRCYKQIRIGFSQYIDVDGTQVEPDNMIAMKILCESYEFNMNKLKEDGDITDNMRAIRKKNEKGQMRPVPIISIKSVTPMQTVTTKSKTGEVTELENPRYWINVAEKRYFGKGAPAPRQLEDVYYFDADRNAPDTSKPFEIFEFDNEFYNIDGFYRDPRTDKRFTESSALSLILMETLMKQSVSITATSTCSLIRDLH